MTYPLAGRLTPPHRARGAHATACTSNPGSVKPRTHQLRRLLGHSQQLPRRCSPLQSEMKVHPRGPDRSAQRCGSQHAAGQPPPKSTGIPGLTVVPPSGPFPFCCAGSPPPRRAAIRSTAKRPRGFFICAHSTELYLTSNLTPPTPCRASPTFKPHVALASTDSFIPVTNASLLFALRATGPLSAACHLGGIDRFSDTLWGYNWFDFAGWLLFGSLSMRDGG